MAFRWCTGLCCSRPKKIRTTLVTSETVSWGVGCAEPATSIEAGGAVPDWARPNLGGLVRLTFATLFPKPPLPAIPPGEHPKTYLGPVAATTRTPTSDSRTGEDVAVPGRSFSLAGCSRHWREPRDRREISSGSPTLAALHRTPTASSAVLPVVGH